MTIWQSGRSVIVVGGGFTGTLFALAAAAQRLDVVLIERARVAGPGLAYGTRASCHLLNVPVSRMEVGLQPGFAQWLPTSGIDLSEALEEADGDLEKAFVPRQAFGAYLAGRLEAALGSAHGRLRRIRGEVVRICDGPLPAVLLADGRRIEGTHVVLATGNMPPRPPRCRDRGVYDGPLFIADPWQPGELDALSPTAPLLLLGSGLTMVDVALVLVERGHVGPIRSLSRHGLLPRVHARASVPGTVTPVFDGAGTGDPVRAMRHLRAAAARAMAAGVPWQRVMDAARPSVAAVWASWSRASRARFLRHARTYWEVHRHRMAPRVAAAFDRLVAAGRVEVLAGRLSALDRVPGGIAASIRRRSGRPVTLEVAGIIDCTGPRSDFAAIAVPPFEELLRRGLMVPDPLGLGIETRGAAVVDRYGDASDWLFALGPLTRPAFWEMTAVPEITIQARRLAETLARPAGAPRQEAHLIADFVNLGEGI